MDSKTPIVDAAEKAHREFTDRISAFNFSAVESYSGGKELDRDSLNSLMLSAPPDGWTVARELERKLQIVEGVNDANAGTRGEIETLHAEIERLKAELETMRTWATESHKRK